MTTPRESKAALALLTDEAVATAVGLLERFRGSAVTKRAALLDGVPDLIGYYAEGSATLAADFYEDQRELAGVRSAFAAEVVVLDRTEKIRRAVAWSAAPLILDPDDILTAASRLSEVVQPEVARPYRDTILANRQNDPESAGWRRITAGGCKLCRMLADRGAVYRQATATFAAHPSCRCTAQPVFKTDVGEEASVIQYVASQRKRSPQQQEALREYLAAFY